MACYAAVLSLMHTLNQIKKHPLLPISLDHTQVASLTQNLIFLQDFLECLSSSNSKEGDDLESRIAAAAYAAEDLIDSHIVEEQIHAPSNICTVDLCQCLRSVTDLIKKEVMKIMGAQIVVPIHAGLYRGLERVIADMDLIKKEVMEIKKVKNMGAQHDDQLHTYGRPASAWQNSTMVDFDEVLLTEILDKLTGQQSGRQIISIVGMGGIGKTTLTRNVCQKPLIVQHFDILVWVTISQEYSIQKILSQVLPQENKGSEMSEYELGERVHKVLWGRRYLIVMDDLWSTEPWDRVKSFFPDNDNGSRIIITTRLSCLAFDLSGSQVFQMNFLDENKNWNLLWEIVFGKGLDCPMELANIGKEIARNCRGLPLSIVVIGGLLKKSNGTRAHWEHTLRNLNSLINLEDGEYCLQILRTSYKELPIHLKPCFMYMGVFREDDEFHVSDIIKLWVAEGILRPTKDKRLEEVAQECIKELIDRNLILVHKLRWNGEAKVCKLHDLLRDLCLREGQKQRFLRVLKNQEGLNIPECMYMERRICIHHIHSAGGDYSPEFLHALGSASLTRSLIMMWDYCVYLLPHGFRSLRVQSKVQKHSGIGFVEAVFQNANLRCLVTDLDSDKFFRPDPSSWLIHWNAHTRKVYNLQLKSIMAPSEIWEMPLLRHVIITSLELPDPVARKNDLILEDLHTLSLRNFKFSRGVIKRIPNLKKLKLYYELFHGKTECLDCSVQNFGDLKELQSLNLGVHAFGIFRGVFRRYWVQNLSLPHSLKMLTLSGTMLNWEECTTKIGSLPLLQFLRLKSCACYGPEWETVEGQFCSLKLLQINDCELRYWTTDSTHFPRLEHLVLRDLKELEEIPSCIGDIPTLKSIHVEYCNTSAVDSANRIITEQEEYGNEELQVIIDSRSYYSISEKEDDQTFWDEEDHQTFWDEEEEDQTILEEEEEEDKLNQTCIINLGKDSPTAREKLSLNSN